ncbi:MAG TPA: NAD(P)/FAD-dependent oxidoreductase [Roseococcus sp.]|jgi:putative flavoprotein involved in K+ transport|nr:NAD(P)/FAD-dependent oxidoreductase [Roseococcus sp.]
MNADTQLAPAQVVETWLRHFNAAQGAAPGEEAALAPLFREDGHWRDLLALTWNFVTHSGRDATLAALAPALRQAGARGFAVAEGRCPPRRVERAGEACIEAILRFETDVGEGAGILRIKAEDSFATPPAAWTLMTALHSLRGHDEESVRLSREEPAFERDFRGPNWLDKRLEARLYKDRDPAVLIVGGGHAGLGAAASLKALGVEALVVDRMARIGDNWRLRYHGLKLHNSLGSNHMPYLPFPDTWPTYIPKDKIANWLEFYVEALELDFWTRTSFEGATFDEAAQCWNATLKLEDGSTRVMRPRHIIMATSVSSVPKLPDIPTLGNFQGKVLHSSQFKDGAEWEGRPVMVFGTGTSAHDITQDLHGNGAHVTMVQRSPTLVTNVEPAAQLYDGIYYGPGPVREDRDLINTSFPLPVMKRAHQILTAKSRELDAELLAGLERVGFRLDFGEDNTGWPLKYRTRGGGYYFNVGASELLIRDEVGLIQYHDIAHFAADGVVMKDGTRKPAELIVLATGYKGHEHMVNAFFGPEVAKRVGQVWGFDMPRQELANMWHRTPQQGLWFTGGAFSQVRMYSRYIALQIKAQELGWV